MRASSVVGSPGLARATATLSGFAAGVVAAVWIGAKRIDYRFAEDGQHAAALVSASSAPSVNRIGMGSLSPPTNRPSAPVW